MDEMEDIEDMARDPVDNAPLGLHLPQHGRSNGTNGVAIKPRRRIAANFGAIREDLSSLSVTGTTEGAAKVPGTQVSLADQIFFFQRIWLGDFCKFLSAKFSDSELWALSIADNLCKDFRLLSQPGELLREFVSICLRAIHRGRYLMFGPSNLSL
jgi:hypothetical protein